MAIQRIPKIIIPCEMLQPFLLLLALMKEPNFIEVFLLLLVEMIFGLAYQGKDVVFRFVIEYSSLRDFYRPLGNHNGSIFI